MTDRPDPPNYVDIDDFLTWCDEHAERPLLDWQRDLLRRVAGGAHLNMPPRPMSRVELLRNVPGVVIDEAYFLDPATSLMPPTVPALGRHVVTVTTAEWLADQRPWSTLETEAWTALHERYARPTTEEAQP